MSFSVRKIDERKRRIPWKTIALTGLQLGRPALRWYSSWKNRRDQEQRSVKRVTLLKRTVIILLSVLLALGLLAGVAKALIAVRVLTVSHVQSLTGTAPPTDNQGFTNLLLIGQGDSSHDGTDLTDTIIVASLDPTNTKSVVMLSLPRDVYFLSTEKMGKGKLNTFYRDYKHHLWYNKGVEKPQASLDALTELGQEGGRKLDLDIHGVIKVDFIAFEEAVHAIGGIDIVVPYDINDQEYPDENYGYDPFVINAGPAHLDGETALKYARSRSTTSDFGRSARQQQLIKAMAEKARSENIHKDPTAIIDFLRIFKENVETTLGLRELIGLASLATEMENTRVVTMQLNDRNALYDSYIEPGGMLYTPPRNLFDGASVLLPVSIPEFPVTWKQPQALTSLLFKTRAIYLAQPKISVLNAGAKSGVARRLATELTRYGFTVDVIANASIDDLETTTVAPLTLEDKHLAEFFATVFEVPASDMPAGLPADEVRQVTILLGSDYTYAPLQNLLSQE